MAGFTPEGKVSGPTSMLRHPNLALAAFLILSTFQVALAADQPPPLLQMQQGTIDDTNKQPDILNGNVEKTDVLDGNLSVQSGTLSKPENGNPSSSEDNSELLFGDLRSQSRTIILDGKSQQDLGKMLNSASSFFKLFVGQNGNAIVELGSREPSLSPEEYRKMEYGVIGIDALLQLGGPGPVITRVFPGTPAESAGLRKGDLIVKAKDHVFKPGEGQRVLWQIVAGRAGTPVDISVLRDGEVVKFHMLRMNIEDIPDQSKRRQYEVLLSALGAPHYDADGDLTDSAIKDRNELNSLGRYVTRKKLILDLNQNND